MAKKTSNSAKTDWDEKPFPRLRAFCSTAILTFCMLLLVFGFVVADYNTRRVGFGDSSIRIDVTEQDGRIMMNLLGREKVFQVSDTIQKWAGRIWNLFPPSTRTIVWIFESERDGAAELLSLAGAGSE